MQISEGLDVYLGLEKWSEISTIRDYTIVTVSFQLVWKINDNVLIEE